jgi:YD repeat-containing protein
MKRSQPFLAALVALGLLLAGAPLRPLAAAPERTPVAAVPALTPVAAAPTPLTNLAHLDFLGDTVTPPIQAGHSTYRLAEEPSLGVLWTYAEPQADGTYRRLGGGTYHPETNTYGQGAFNTDDLTRAAVVYIRHWRQFDDAHSRLAAYQLLRTVAYMQTVTDDARRGNFILWMQPDGTLNPSADPKELPDPSDSGPAFWLARSIWALGEGYEAFRRADPAFATFLRGRLGLALDALDREVLVHYGSHRLLDGARVPAWLIVDGADATSEAIYGLSAFVRARPADARARRDLKRLADGVAEMALSRGPGTWPFGAILPFAGSRSLWHAWGDQMAGALATAGSVLHARRFVASAVAETARFTPRLLAQGGADQGWLPAPAERAQIAYGADATLQNLLRTADASGRDGFRKLAAIQAAWYFGNNRAGVAMYDPATGRTFDGLEADGRINRNSGAESTIHGLLSMLALDARPNVAAAATARNTRMEDQTWTLLEAEAGTISGNAQVITPPSAWTGESLWSGGQYVELGRGGRVTVEATLPEAGRYRLLPVFDRQEAPLRSIGTRHRFDERSLGTLWHGGAGAPGISPTSGYLDIGNVGSGRSMPAGPVAIESAYVGDGRPVRLDAMLLQPEIERLLLAGDDGRQGLLRSWATKRRLATVDAGSGLTAYAYDADGRLVESVSGSGRLRVPVEPFGFTYLIGG